ncbi:cell wall hydrolase [Syntrophotalea acetylenica]|nr:cell wall hydrolase [Syntrophotalea acetylenica]APG44469.1 hypothetical protein A6070_10365 [Syntrophotalea acetylenica]
MMTLMRIKVCVLVFCGLIFSSFNSWANETITADQRIKLCSFELSEEDRDAIGRVTYAEAGDQGDSGMAAVVHVILNRLISGEFGSSITQILNAKNQFEPATRAGGWKNLPSLTPRQRARIDTIINLSLDGRLPDLTNGSLYFQNPVIVAQREAAGQTPKGLIRFNGSTPAAVIRDHEFYSVIKNQKTIPVLVQAQKPPAPEPWDIYAIARRLNLQENASRDVFTRKATGVIQ